jgi:glycerol-3-phosphate dehydrogenase
MEAKDPFRETALPLHHPCAPCHRGSARLLSQVELVKLRATNLERLDGGTFDVLVLGGGINGAVSAACLAARGVKVALDRSRRLRRASRASSRRTWRGAASSTWRPSSSGLVTKLCGSPQRAPARVPVDGAGDPLLHDAHEGVPPRPVEARARHLALLAAGALLHETPRLLSTRDMAREEPIVRLDGVDGGFEYSDAYLHDNDARFVWNFVRRDRPRRGRRELRRVARARARGGPGITTARDAPRGETIEMRSRIS